MNMIRFSCISISVISCFLEVLIYCRTCCIIKNSRLSLTINYCVSSGKADLSPNSDIMTAEDYGFIRPSLVKQLRAILDQYPDNSQILKVICCSFLLVSRPLCNNWKCRHCQCVEYAKHLSEISIDKFRLLCYVLNLKNSYRLVHLLGFQNV